MLQSAILLETKEDGMFNLLVLVNLPHRMYLKSNSIFPNVYRRTNLFTSHTTTRKCPFNSHVKFFLNFTNNDAQTLYKKGE